MGWQDLVEKPNEEVVLPWVGGSSLRSATRIWHVERQPQAHGWYRFRKHMRLVRVVEATAPQPELLQHTSRGFLVGDRIVVDGAQVPPDPATIASYSERVHLIEDGLDRFVRISAGRVYEDGPLIFKQQEMPIGVEDAVMQAFLDAAHSIAQIKGVPPALDAAFRMEVWQREQAEKRRAELERIRLEEEAKRQREERRRQLVNALGDGAGRREMAQVDFDAAARAALAVGGATLLDVRKGYRQNERVVRYRLDGRRYESVCDLQMRIIDAGICLTDHDGEKGDTYFTLESICSVIREADREGVLVVLRHV